MSDGEIFDAGFITDNDVFLISAMVPNDLVRVQCTSQSYEFAEEGYWNVRVTVPKKYDFLESIFFPFAVDDLMIEYGSVKRRIDGVGLKRVEFLRIPSAYRNIVVTYKLNPDQFQGKICRVDGGSVGRITLPIFTMIFDRNHPQFDEKGVQSAFERFVCTTSTLGSTRSEYDAKQ